MAVKRERWAIAAFVITDPKQPKSKNDPIYLEGRFHSSDSDHDIQQSLADVFADQHPEAQTFTIVDLRFEERFVQEDR